MLSPTEADEIAARVNRYGIGPWLLALLARLGAAVPHALAAPRERVAVEAPAEGLGLVLYRRAEAGTPHWSDALVLERARFDASLCGLPFGLNAAETPDSARATLSADSAGDTDRVSYFLADASVVELTFRPGGTGGLSQVLVARLGAEQQWV